VRVSGPGAEKIGRDGFTFQRGGRWQSAGNTRQVSALRKRGDAQPPEGTPWGSGFGLLRRSETKEREGHEEGVDFFEYPVGATLGGAEAQEGMGLDPFLRKSGVRKAPLVP
jgi:hypothetical protein